jgi:phenylalanyl-tRNA synthetase beta chain
MLIPLSWLREYVDFDMQPEKLAERLTMLGMEVQSVARRGDDWRSVVVGELLEVGKHPNADGLSLTKVRVGDGRKDLSIVCGATNIAVGQRVPVALPGAVLPGERSISVSKIRGEQSEGMLCSGAELRLSEDADGILILPKESPVGEPLAKLYGDVVLDIDVKPNRGDALSVIGIAREVAAITGSPLRWPPIEVPERGDASSDHVGVTVQEPRLCPRFVARYVDEVVVGPSPLDMQLRLASAGVRPLSNVVDATNYVMLEMGKPTHVFDAKAVERGQIVVRLAKRGERLETLDHVDRELTTDTLVIADPVKPLGIAGVMGGAESEVGERTGQVIIESAIFDPASLRRTAQRYGLRSEASARFEKGQEWRLARVGADRVAQLIAAWANGRPAVGAVDSNPSEPAPVRVAFRPGRVSRLLGTRISGAESRELLGRVGAEFEAAESDVQIPVADGHDGLSVSPTPREQVLVAVVPPHRRDLVIEADIAEEIARVRGYESIAPQLPNTLMPPYRPDPEDFPNRVRDLLSARGLSEAVCYATVGPADHARLGIAPDDPATIHIANPISQEHSELRRSLLPGLVRALATNERQRRADVAFFELGRTHRYAGGKPVESEELGMLLAGEWQRGGWNQQARAADLSDLTGLISWLGDRLHLGALRFERSEPNLGVEHPGRTAKVIVERTRVEDDEGGVGRRGEPVQLGRAFELDPRYLRDLEIRAERVVFAELDLALMESLAPDRFRIAPIPRAPSVERDVAVIVERTRSAGEVAEVIREAAGELLRDLRLFDRYEGPQVGENEVSLAYRLHLQSDQTLTDAEVDAVMNRVRNALRARLGGRIRE